ncbi:hypothetical protein LTR62_008769 [Meristemomyces frigidus]|uniref:Uncharacterized protein n=1 Tax=Meristemomyces frigidus TaxID=1508187 RepID=A0AAN7TD71_9PEZI|nr:hypothetical protein LTR62_008769 [Meristemomyces frigidus]
MSKLSEGLKAFINASHARPNTTPAGKTTLNVYNQIAKQAAANQVGLPAWLTATTATTMTLNSPQSLLQLYGLATSPEQSNGKDNKVWAAELMREVGLKCIGLNGVPRTINSLGAFFDGLPASVQTELKKRQPRRLVPPHLTPESISHTTTRASGLWDSIYHPFTDKLTKKLAQSHPDLPVFIIESEYGALFSDPPYLSSSSSTSDNGSDIGTSTPPNIGRVLMSILAVSVLRAQTGVGPQVVSHLFGLRKAFQDGTAAAEPAVEGGEWLAGNEGAMWLLESVDQVVESMGGSSFAAGYRSYDEALKAKL